MKPFLLALLAAAAVLGGTVVLSNSVPQEKVQAFAEAIAFAEGFYVAGSRPARNNNPGDLTLTGDLGKDGMYGVWSTLQAGWDALYHMLQRDLSGNSTIYSPDMTIQEFANKYTATDQTAWASNVASQLGVTPDTKISDWLGA